MAREIANHRGGKFTVEYDPDCGLLCNMCRDADAEVKLRNGLFCVVACGPCWSDAILGLAAMVDTARRHRQAKVDAKARLTVFEKEKM